jgi:hypothetical protein
MKKKMTAVEFFGIIFLIIFFIILFWNFTLKVGDKVKTNSGTGTIEMVGTINSRTIYWVRLDEYPNVVKRYQGYQIEKIKKIKT